MYYTYMLRCDDNSIYTGITTNLERRMKEHFNRTEKCAKYTLIHKAKSLEFAWKSESKQTASKLEYHIKRLTKREKEQLISKEKELKDIFNERINPNEYKLAQIDYLRKMLYND